MSRETSIHNTGPRSLFPRLTGLDHSRVASLLLLLPLVAVAVCSGVGIAANDAASKALDNADQIGIQVSRTLDQVHEVALSGTSFLVGDAHEDSAAMVSEGQQVAVLLAGLTSLPGMSANEVSAVRVAEQAWGASARARAAVLATPASGSASAPDRHGLEDQLNNSLTLVVSPLATLDAINTSDVNSREQERAGTELISAVAIALAVMAGLLGALWLLAMLRERQEAVRRRERRFAALVEHASDGILVVDASGAIIFVTPAFREGSR